VDDLILNTLGVALGYALAWGWAWRGAASQARREDRSASGRLAKRQG
jgi:hypothetical protein